MRPIVVRHSRTSPGEYEIVNTLAPQRGNEPTFTVVPCDHDCDHDDEEYEDDDEVYQDEEPEFDTVPTITSTTDTNAGTADDGCICLICQDPLRVAYVPPCGHPLCGTCTTRLFSHGSVSPVKCPQCRTPVHQKLYSRCQALEKAALKVYPLDPSEKSQEKYTPTPIEKWTDTEILSWKTAETEKRINDTLRVILKCIKKCCLNSNAFILDEAGRNMQVYKHVLKHPELCMLNLYFWQFQDRFTELLSKRGFSAKSYVVEGEKIAVIEW